jgi:hypothetical protein
MWRVRDMMIHRYWTGDAPLQSFSEYTKKVASRLGDVTDWTDETLPEHIRELADQHENDVPNNRPRQRANVVRLALLHEFGGVWIDHDVLFFRDPSIGVRGLWAASSNGRLCSAVIGSDAGDPLLSSALSMLKPADSTPEASGELLLGGLWAYKVHTYPFLLDYNGGIGDQSPKPWAIHLWSTG